MALYDFGRVELGWFWDLMRLEGGLVGGLCLQFEVGL